MEFRKFISHQTNRHPESTSLLTIHCRTGTAFRKIQAFARNFDLWNVPEISTYGTSLNGVWHFGLKNLWKTEIGPQRVLPKHVLTAITCGITVQGNYVTAITNRPLDRRCAVRVLDKMINDLKRLL